MEWLGDFEAALTAEVDVQKRDVGPPQFLETQKRVGSRRRHADDLSDSG
ncbi:MAG: hypothetical protein JWR46_4100 [Mycobacterium sp.]|nr:hypothetical protein [Mycobacterium sp.]